MSYLKDNARFAGTGERDANGYTLDEFLNSYDPRKYDSPCNTVDMLVFRSKEPYRRKDQPLKLLLIKRKNHPSIGFWATPGGFADVYENLEDSAKRELLEETGVSGIPLIQLGTWGDYDRDPRWRIITTAYLALVEGDLAEHAGDDAADAAWFDAKLVPTESMPSAGDSKQIPTEKETPAGAGADKDKNKEYYTLLLDCPERDLHLSAEICVTWEIHGLLRKRHYSLIRSEKLAADHPLLIADALLYLYDLAQ